MKFSSYLSLPIKSLNIAVKTEIANRMSIVFKFDGKGCIYKDVYYDFRVSRAIIDSEVLSYDKADDVDIHINQILHDDIFLVIIFKDKAQAYILDRKFFNRKLIEEKLTYQHKKKYYQLHISIKLLNEFTKVTFEI